MPNEILAFISVYLRVSSCATMAKGHSLVVIARMADSALLLHNFCAINKTKVTRKLKKLNSKRQK